MPVTEQSNFRRTKPSLLCILISKYQRGLYCYTIFTDFKIFMLLELKNLYNSDVLCYNFKCLIR